MVKVQTGYMPFGKYQTYYRIVGEATTKAPLVLIHGGPGSTHNYFEVLDELAETNQRQLIMYDQIGCGQSSCPDNHAAEIYRAQIWLEELVALRRFLQLDRIHLLGQSWGGMLEIMYLCDLHPRGVLSGILASTLPASWLWSKELHRLIKFMPDNEQAAIRRAEKTKDFTNGDYQSANHHFMAMHCNAPLSSTDPEPLLRPKREGKQAYLTAWGPNEYTPIGNLQSFDYLEQLHEIKIPMLITSGTDDLCTPYVAKTMYDRLPNAKWELFEGCRHMSFVEKREQYLHVLASWLDMHDKKNVS